MTNYQESYEKMSLACVAFLLANGIITDSIPNFIYWFLIVQSTNAQIKVAQVKQETKKGSNKTTKKQLKAALIILAVDISRRTVAYATNENNNDLLSQVNYSESELKRGSETKLVNSCQVIHDSANVYIKALETYGVTPVINSDFQNQINAYSDVIPQVRVETADSAEVTKLLSSLFKTLAKSWEKIDILIDMVRISQPVFYSEYKKIRKIIETGSGSLALKINVTNAQTGKPEAKVTMSFASTNGQLKLLASNGKDTIEKKTAKGGGVYYKNLPDGTYSVTAKKPGFKDVVQTVIVVNGELNVLEILMEKV